MTVARRRPALAWVGGALAAVLLLVGAYLLVRRDDGDIAVELIEAIEDGDLDEVAALTYTDTWLPEVDGPFPDFPWTDAHVVEVSPDDSHHDYDVTVEVASTDLTLSGLRRMSLEVGTISGTEVVLNATTEATVTAEDAGPLTSVTIGGRDLGSGTSVRVWLLPGIYQVTATGADGGALSGRLTVIPAEEARIELGNAG